jgi:hypothetical protein
MIPHLRVTPRTSHTAHRLGEDACAGTLTSTRASRPERKPTNPDRILFLERIIRMDADPILHRLFADGHDGRGDSRLPFLALVRPFINILQISA